MHEHRRGTPTKARATWMPAGYGPVRSFGAVGDAEGDLIEIIVTVALPA